MHTHKVIWQEGMLLRPQHLQHNDRYYHQQLNRNGRSSLVLERGTARAMGIEKNTGAWSWFRLLDLMQSEPASGREAQILKADVAGLRANYLLTSQSNPSPFHLAAWRTFRLPEQL